MNYVCRMNSQTLHDEFISALQNIYGTQEAENIWKLTIEKVSGTNPGTNNSLPRSVTDDQANQIKIIIQRLLTDEPIQYILQECWFYDIPFFVNKDVLIPRPETEELVDWIIKENKKQNDLTILDVGTGSGCIPVILKRKVKHASIMSCDVSADALIVAKQNAMQYDAAIQFFHLDFLNEASWKTIPKVDIIVSNPPYIPEKDKTGMRDNVLKYEPHLALFVKDSDPLIFYKALAKFGRQLLKPGGRIYVEIHEDLPLEVSALFNKNGYETTIKKDMQGKDRMVKASFSDNLA